MERNRVEEISKSKGATHVKVLLLLDVTERGNFIIHPGCGLLYKQLAGRESDDDSSEKKVENGRVCAGDRPNQTGPKSLR